ncbi:MAG: hypothetical protein V7661_05630 [Sulfitobacter sp.]
MYDCQISRDIALTRQRLGPQPAKALRVLVDLGLDDCEIGRYHSVPRTTVSALRTHYRITAANIILNPADPLIGEMDTDKYLAWILNACDGNNFSCVTRSGGKSDTAKSKLRQLAISVRSYKQVSSKRFCIQRWEDEGGATRHNSSPRIAI